MKSGLLLRESRRVRIRYEARAFTINEYRLHTKNSAMIILCSALLLAYEVARAYNMERP
jgi:hypothetical protein